MAYFERRVGKDGKISHRVLIRLKGFPPQSASFERLTDAREWARNTETAIKERRYFKTTESKKRTVKDMIERYLKYLETHNPKRIADVGPMLAWWNKEIGYVVLADLTRAQISEKIDILSQRQVKIKGKIQKISPARVNRFISAFSHCCSHAVNQWEWLEQNPMQKIKKKTEPRGRVRFLDDDERERLLEACKRSSNRHLYLVVVLALSTGARKNEIMSLKWKDNIDLNRGVITLHHTKNGERRILPLTGKALSLFQEHRKVRRLDSPYVFPSFTGEKPTIIRDAWEAALKEANIMEFRFHDLRHSAASYLAMNGASLAEIAEVLGHKTLAMVKRYSHLSEAHTHGVVSRMNERIFGNGQ